MQGKFTTRTAKRFRLHNSVDQRLHRIILPLHSFNDLIQSQGIRRIHLTTEPKSEQMSRKSADKAVFFLKNRILKFDNIGKFVSSEKSSTCIHFPSIMIFFPPPADRIKVLQGKPDWIHKIVATRTDWIGSVFFELLPHRRSGVDPVFLKRWYVRRGRRRRCANNVLQYPIPSNDWRSTGRVGGHC